MENEIFDTLFDCKEENIKNAFNFLTKAENLRDNTKNTLFTVLEHISNKKREKRLYFNDIFIIKSLKFTSI